MCRKNLTAAFLIISSVSLIGCEATTVHVVVDTPATTETLELEGKWLSDCMDMSGNGSAYTYIYVTITGSTEALAILGYGADATCTGAHTMTNMNGDPLTEPETTFTLTRPFIAYADHPGYARISISTLDQSLHIYQLFYIASATEFYSAGNPPTIDPGSSWAQMSGDAGLADIAADFHNGVHFTKVNSMP